MQASEDASCYDATQNVAPLFAFSIVPGGQITQCTPTRIWWDPAVVWKPTATVRTTARDSKIAAAQGRECTEQKAHRGRLETLAYYKAVLIEATVDDGEEEGQQFSLS